MSASAGELRDAWLATNQIRGEAIAAYRAGDIAAARDGFREILTLRPGHPATLYNIAALSARLDDHEAAISHLEQLAALGLTADVGADEDFAGLKDDPRFQPLVARLEGNAGPIAKSRVAFTLESGAGLVEGIAYDGATQMFFLSSISEGRIYRVDPADGRASIYWEYGVTGAIAGIWGMAVDAASQELWVVNAVAGPVRGNAARPSSEDAALVFDLRSGQLIRTIQPSAEAAAVRSLNDIALATTGTAYLTASQSPDILRYEEADGGLSPLAAHDLASPQGAAVSPDGRALIVADYALGLLRVDIADGNVARLPMPPDTALRGIDGLSRYKDGLIAIQNGTNPRRILRIHLNDDWTAVIGTRVLERAHPEWEEPTLGVVAGDVFYYIANSGWTYVTDGPPDLAVLEEERGPIKVMALDLAEALDE